jgi:hypothetical protein
MEAEAVPFEKNGDQEWHRLLTICLDGDTLDDHTVDPFLALKHGECIAVDIAYKLRLAPKRIPKPDDIRRSVPT